MSTVKIDSSNPQNFQRKKVMPKGRYTFEVAGHPDDKGDLRVEVAKSSSNNIVKLELRCTSDGEFKGNGVYDTIAITPKAEWRLVHLALACAAQTKAEIEADGVDLSLLKGCALEAEIDVEPAKPSADGATTYREKNRVAAYLFEPES